MRTLVTGAKGMLARAALALLDEAATLACDLPECDITDARAIRRATLEFYPSLILHLAAYTNVDGAEADPDTAFAVNASGSENVARAAADIDARLVAVSTDYVFDGTLSRPLLEDDPVGPLSVYGRSKLEGEQRALAAHRHTVIVRTAWLFGAGGKNFIDAIASKLAAGEAVRVVDDQIGRPTYTTDLAAGILKLAEVAPTGVFHLTNSGEPASWFEVARHVATCVGADPGLVAPTTSDEFARPAPRPAYSVLDCSKAERAGVARLPGWKDAVARHLASA